MKSLYDLKKELVSGKVNNLYVFTGEEYLIRKIYYEKIAELNGKLRYVETVNNLFPELEKKSLFKTKATYVVYNDLEFLKQKDSTFNRLIELGKDNVVVLVYDEIPSGSRFEKVFNEFITVFNKVTTDVAIKYVHKESPIIRNSKFLSKMAYNCDNSYGMIVEEMNKFNNLNLNENDSLDAMTYATIFLDRKETPSPRELADDIILGRFNNISQYYQLLKKENILGYIPELYSTIYICLYFKLYGKYEGSSAAYNAGEYWGRVKQLREYNIIYNKNDLLDIRYMLNKLDLDVRKGRMPSEYAWDFLIGVII